MLKVTLLGTGGMMPLKDRALASAMVSVNGRQVLIDCGEGTQVQLRVNGMSFKPIDGVLITHFHGDHVSGLPGLLLSMGNGGREEPLLIAGPTGLGHVVDALRVIAPELPFEVQYLELDPESPAPFTCAGLKIAPFPLKHSMPCLGYRLHLPRPGKFQPERARENGVPMRLWSVLQKQAAATLDGVTYTRDMVLTPPRPGLTVVYATDTRPVPAIAEAARDCDLLVLEAMYGDPDKLPRAVKSGHMLMEEAAHVAADAGARRLWLTHYSPAMPEPELWLDRAREIFPETVLGTDGMSVDLGYRE
ncbi:MAG: ribonuclease Z [Clostridia bacterium]|nr:ribonuclease Z [Clostridia bacterium]